MPQSVGIPRTAIQSIIDRAERQRNCGLPPDCCYADAKSEYKSVQSLSGSHDQGQYDAFIRKLCNKIGF